MKKSVLTKLICIVLVLTTAAIVPMQALATTGGKTEYISELMLASNSDANAAKQELIDKGFTVIDNNLNDGVSKKKGDVQATYLGYKTTTDRNEAITDMRVMDMKGGYSVSDYESALKQYEEEVKEKVYGFKDTLAEFREKYLAKSKNAEFAYKQLNKFIEDDSGMKIGDICIEEDPDEDVLTKMVMQANPDTLQATELLLAIGCADNWVEKIQNNSGTDYSGAEAVASLGEFAPTILDKWGSLASGLRKYAAQLGTDDGYDLSKYNENEYNIWAKGRSDEEICNLNMYGAAYIILDKYQFNGQKLSKLFQAENPSDATIYMVADAMSLGQIQTLDFSSLELAVILSSIDADQIENFFSENETKINQEAISDINAKLGAEDKPAVETIPQTESIYAGVDRSLFAKDGSVALTDDALRKKATKGDQKLREAILGEKLTIIIAPIVITAITALLFWGAVSSYKESLGPIIGTIGGASSFTSFKVFLGAAIAFVALDLIVIGLTVGLGLKNYYYPDYDRVPRVIVDHVVNNVYDENGNLIETKDDRYVVYYATLDAEAQGSELKFGDLNGWCAKQWNALYYTKDKCAGNPITADIIVNYGNSAIPSGYSPLEYFGENGIAYDINTHVYDTKGGAYIFYTEDSTVSAVASAFSIGFIAIAAFGGLVVGAVIAYFVTKKKFGGKTPENPISTVL